MAKEADLEEDEDRLMRSSAFFLPRFNTLHSLAYEQLKNKENSAAKETYQRMVELYNDLNKSNTHASEKQKAYGKLMFVFTALSNPDYYQNGLGEMQDSR